MMRLQTYSDIAAGMAELSEYPGFEHLPKRLDRLSALSACCADLRFAQDCITALDELIASPRGVNRPTRQATETSLLMAAVNLYARATVIAAQRKGERGGSSIIASLGPDERRDHDAIVEVRHRGLTHVTPNATLADGEVWSMQRALAIDNGEGWILGFATRNVGVRVALLDQVRRQIAVAERILGGRLQEWIAKLGAEVKKVPGWDGVLRKHLVDPDSIFGSSAATAKATAPIAKGETMTSFFTVER